ncbi:MAG TPA: DUF5666 domain-containing protein [Acidobacteriaceae bacterium]|nr:DUF5666 domain-containing protein [Acidobacteriaceae bacterium]
MTNRLLFLSVLTSLFVVSVIVITGCGGGSSPGGTTVPPSQNCVAPGAPTAQVPLLFTSDAALGPLTSFQLGITSIMLTDACGHSVTAYTGPTQANTVQGVSTIEITHVNGVSEPLTVTTLPQATYATASVSYTVVDIAYLYPDNLHFVDSLQVTNPISGAVELAAPIVVDGKGTVITLDTLLTGPIVLGPAAVGSRVVTVTPAFSVSEFRPATTPSSDRNGKANLHGIVSSIGEGQFTMNNSSGFPLTISASSSTVLQGIGSLSALPPNVPADVDVAIQTDGSLLATRIQVEDASALGAWIGPLVGTYSTGAYQEILPRLWQDPTSPTHTSNDYPYRFQFTDNTPYQLNGAAYDLTDLPFTPTFVAFSDVALGQGLSISWTTQQLLGSQPQTEARAATLMPRTFSGSITSVITQDNYTEYTLTLANNDFMVPLNNVTSITAYTNAGTRMEDGPLSMGMAVNLHGLLFSDRGALRLVCDQTRLQQSPNQSD